MYDDLRSDGVLDNAENGRIRLVIDDHHVVAGNKLLNEIWPADPQSFSFDRNAICCDETRHDSI